MELIIHPGDNPLLSKYIELANAFILAIEYGQHTKKMTLNFNFDIKAQRFLHCEIVRSFLQIGRYYPRTLPPSAHSTVVTRIDESSQPSSPKRSYLHAILQIRRYPLARHRRQQLPHRRLPATPSHKQHPRRIRPQLLA